jgi:hypothetical protein
MSSVSSKGLGMDEVLAGTPTPVKRKVSFKRKETAFPASFFLKKTLAYPP